MPWVKRLTPEEAHKCKLPYITDHDYPDRIRPDGMPGEFWGCHECGTVFKVMRGELRLNYFTRANRREQRKYWPRYSCNCRVGKGKESSCKTLSAEFRNRPTVHGKFPDPPGHVRIPPVGGSGASKMRGTE